MKPPSSLTIGIATRGRPGLLKTTIEQTASNIANPYTRLVVLIDDDDEETIHAAGTWYEQLYIPNLYYSINPRPLGLGAKYNLLVDKYPDDVYLVMVDYAPHITPGFDTKIIEAASLYLDNIAIVYNNLVENLPAINAVTHRFVELNNGWIYPPWFPYGFVDIWLDDVAKAIGRIAYCDINIDRSRRPGTQGKRDERFWRTFYNLTVALRIESVNNIINKFDKEGYQPRSLDALRNNVNMWMQRALIHHMTGNLSDNSRMNWPEQFGGAAPDTPYHKACRAQAVTVLENMVAAGMLQKENMS